LCNHNNARLRRLAQAAALLIALSASACNSIIALDVVRSPLEPPDPGPNPVLVLQQSQNIVLDTGYERTLNKGSHWQLAGTIVEGKVYKPIDGEFTIQGREPVSAYIVVSNGQLVGFFLPVEDSFSPLYKKISISFGAGDKKGEPMR